MRKFNKIFGIGISRTGTSSLTEALKMLGLATTHWPGSMDDLCRYRAATDITVACRFKELDLIFPDSLFIYTERDKEGWLASVTGHYHRIASSPKQAGIAEAFRFEAGIRIYGKLKPAAADFPAAYQRHHRKVLQYFRDKPGRFLRMNIVQGDGWPELCRFLEIPVRREPFPHANKKT